MARSLLKYVILIVFLQLSLSSAASAGNRCAEIFTPLGGKVGDTTVSRVATEFPTLGIVGSQNGFTILSTNGSQTVGNAGDLVAALTAAIATHNSSKGNLEMYFHGVEPRRAWNIISDVRLRAAGSSDKIEAYVDTPAALGSAPPPPRPPGTTHAATAGEHPESNRSNGAAASGGGGNGEPPDEQALGSEGGSEPWRAAAAFRRLENRYDWRRAEIENISTDAPTMLASITGFDPRAYTYKVVVPKTKTEPGIRLSVFVFFKKDTQKPNPGTVQSSIQSALHDDDLRRATIQKAAKRVRQRVQKDYPESQTLFNALDLTIVVIEAESSDG